jgi:hypothetical protein
MQIFHLQVIEAQGTSPMLGWLLSMNVTEEKKSCMTKPQVYANCVPHVSMHF